MDEREWRRWAREVEANDMMAAKECFFAAEDVAVMQPLERRNSALCRIAEARAYIRRNTRRAEELSKRPRQRPLPLEPHAEQMTLFAPAGANPAQSQPRGSERDG